MSFMCENAFCIYEKDGCCILNKISLDSSGRCYSCIYPALDNEYLENEKLKTLLNLEREENLNFKIDDK